MTATLPDTKGDTDAEVTALEHEWATNPRWAGVERTYTAADVVRLRGRVREEHTLARLGAERQHGGAGKQGGGECGLQFHDGSPR